MDEYQQKIDRLINILLINIEIELKFNPSSNQNVKQKLYNFLKLLEYEVLPKKDMFDHNKFFKLLAEANPNDINEIIRNVLVSNSNKLFITKQNSDVIEVDKIIFNLFND